LLSGYVSIDPPLEFRHKLLQASFPANFRIADGSGTIRFLDTWTFPDTYLAVETEMALAGRLALLAIVDSSRCGKSLQRWPCAISLLREIGASS
jgi:hypothetical protein